MAGVFGREMGVLVWNALPVFAFNVSQFANNILSQAFIGRMVGPRELAASALAISYMNVMCQTINFGLATGQETVVSQANGARRYKDVGACLQRGLVVWLASQVVMSVVALFGEKILVLLGQDADLAQMAGTYIIYSLPTMWGMGLSTVVCTWLQAQGIFKVVLVLGTPGLAVQLAGLIILLPRVGYLGAAYATAASAWTSAILFVSYTIYLELNRAPERKTLHAFSFESLKGLGSYIAVAVPSFAMILFEWSALEVIVVFAGLLPGASSGVPTSVSAMIMGAITICYAWSLALSQSSSSRVGNTLGTGDGKMARTRAICAWTAQLIFAVTSQLILYFNRKDWAILFSTPGEVELWTAAQDLYPALAAILFFDANAALLSGVVRGTGLQHIGGILNLASFYVVGIPLAALFTFHFDLGLLGLWTGIALAFFSQAATLGTLVACADFNAIAEKISAETEEHPELWTYDEGDFLDELLLGPASPLSFAADRSHRHSVTASSPRSVSSLTGTLSASLGTSFTMSHRPWS